MGRAARHKWNRRLRQLAHEQAERQRRDEERARDAAGPEPPLSPASFWADWFRRTSQSEGPAFALQVLCHGAIGDAAWQPRAIDWWPEEVRRADVDELKAKFDDIEDMHTGAAAVALVELLADTIATRAMSMPGDSTADGFSAAVINLAVAIKTEIELALKPPTLSIH